MTACVNPNDYCVFFGNPKRVMRLQSNRHQPRRVASLDTRSLETRMIIAANLLVFRNEMHPSPKALRKLLGGCWVACSSAWWLRGIPILKGSIKHFRLTADLRSELAERRRGTQKAMNYHWEHSQRWTTTYFLSTKGISPVYPLCHVAMAPHRDKNKNN